MTWAHERYHAAVALSGLWSSAYADDVLARLAHHSSSIEGNTLTLAETLTLLVEDRSPSGKHLRELYEVANHREALTLVVNAVADDRALDVEFVREVHAALTDHLVWDPGAFKTSENRIAGASFEPLAPSRVPERMRQWADQAAWQTANLDNQELLQAIASSHIQFERMHPFSDGNGRTGRMLIAFQTIARFGYPAIIDPSRKAEYIEMLDSQNAPALRDELLRALASESQRAEPATPPDSSAATSGGVS